MDAPEQEPPGPVRQDPGDPPKSLEEGPPPGPVHLPLHRAPEQFKDLRDHQHRRRPVVADRLEDDPRVAAPHIEDVGADRQRVEQGDRLLHEVRQGQERDEPVLLRRDRVMSGLDRRDDVGVGEHHALGRAGRAGREDDLEEVGWDRARPAADLVRPIGRPVCVRLRGEVLDERGREALEASLAGVRGVPAAAERQVCRLRLLGDPLDGLGRHPEIERDDDDLGPHRPEVDRGQGRRGWGPGQEAVAGSQTGRAQPPRDGPAPPVELAVRPRLRGPVVAPKGERRPVAVAGAGLVQDVEKGLHRRISLRRSRAGVTARRGAPTRHPARRRGTRPDAVARRRSSAGVTARPAAVPSWHERVVHRPRTA